MNVALSSPITRCRSSGVISADVFHLHRPRQQVQARGVLGQRSLEQREVEPRDVLGHVDQRVVGNRVEEHVGVAQAQVEIDQGHGVLRVGRQDAAQVDRQAGGAHAAGRAGHGDHRAAASLAVAAAEAVVADPLQRRHQVFDPHRLRQELFGAGPHGPQDQVAVGRRADDQDAALGRVSCSCATSCRAFSGLWSSATMPMSGCVWATTSAKNSYREHSASSQTMSMPSSIDFSASRVASLRIDDGQSEHVAHGCSATPDKFARMSPSSRSRLARGRLTQPSPISAAYFTTS